MAKRLTCALMEPFEKTRHCGLETSTDGTASRVGQRERPDRRRGELTSGDILTEGDEVAGKALTLAKTLW